jgi:mono/diheme cytochrome c family protein
VHRATRRVPGKAAALLGILAASAILAAAVRAGAPADAPKAASSPADLAREVVPLLQTTCGTCHGPTLSQAQLRLDSREAAIKGGVSGTALVPGNAAESLILRRILAPKDAAVRMPQGLPPLPEETVEKIRAWIDAGAPWPEETTAAAPATTTVSAGGADVDYQTKIRPIFETSCMPCHGPDQQKSGLRLDARTLALKGGLSGKVILPGNAKDSLMVRRLMGQIAPRMPFERTPLPADKIALIKAWIDKGAPGPDDAPAGAKTATHWAYVKPVRPELPVVKRAGWVRNPIDAFVLARLEKEGLAPSPEASKETLVRRLSLDLVGLPPTPEEVEAFVSDSAPDAYEKLVDRLLASPHYGERWARPWLDLARYADSNGYEKDNLRTAWKYRDWVIDAINRDLSFQQFTIEQIAGDMLKDPTEAQKIATGFHRNTLLNQEGGIDVEEARFETLVDRVNTTASVWLGTTMACAQCHNHKYDPVSQKDYYRMLAFYDNIDYVVHGAGEVVVDKWIDEPELDLPTPEQAAERAKLKAEADALEKTLKTDTPALDAARAAWEKEMLEPPAAWTPVVPTSASSSSVATLTIGADGSVVAGGALPEKETYTIAAPMPLDRITGFRLEVIAEPGDPPIFPGRAENGNFTLSGFAVRAAAPVPLVRAQADVNEGGWPVADTLDDSAETGWGVFPEVTSSHNALFVPREPVSGRQGTTLTFTLAHESKHAKHSIRRFRLYATRDADPGRGLFAPDDVKAIARKAAAERSPEEQKKIADYYRGIAPPLDAPRRTLAETNKRLGKLKITTAMVMRERPGFERPSTFLRIRGSFMSPGERVYANVPAFLPPLPEDSPANRLGLARWLVSEDNPLTARVTVNRYWEQLFGRGIVETSEDFGSQGQRPTHPELLDWLATQFVAKGWSPKQMLRLMVTSATYRQTSAVTPALVEKDPYNKLLARGPRFRVEAEMVRDIALSAGGLLSDKVGGPSVFPIQPDGIWNSPYSDEKWTTSEAGDRWRRGLYTFTRRTSPYPSLLTFDAPSREFCTVRRVRTNTPLQALTTLNDPVFFEAARGLAGRIVAAPATAPEARAAYGFRICTSRRPRAEETARLVAFYERERDRFDHDPAAASAVAGGAAGEDTAERAAWTMAANVLLSLDETVTKE